MTTARTSAVQPTLLALSSTYIRTDDSYIPSDLKKVDIRANEGLYLNLNSSHMLGLKQNMKPSQTYRKVVQEVMSVLIKVMEIPEIED